MAKTYFGYWEVGDAIKTTISSLTFRDGTPLLMYEDRQIDSERVVHISLTDRTDQDISMQPIASNQRNSVRAVYAIDVYQGHIEGTEAARLRNRMLEEIEVGLMANPKLNVGSGNLVSQSFLSSVVIEDTRDGDNYWSMCALRLICDKTITTQ